MSIYIRKSDERGKANFGWLDTKYSFSFSNYYDPNFMGFGPLRVINDDYIKGGAGFPTHPHDNMEIITYVLDGALAHKDSLGNGSIIKAGDVQRMSAGTGITHSEFNPSPSETCHLLQIWIVPDKENYTPSYEQINLSPEQKQGKLCLIASNDGRDGSVTIHQDVNLYSSIFNQGDKIDFEIKEGRSIWLQIARGGILFNDIELFEGDGVAIQGEKSINLMGKSECEFLLFDI